MMLFLPRNLLLIYSDKFLIAYNFSIQYKVHEALMEIVNFIKRPILDI